MQKFQNYIQHPLNLSPTKNTYTFAKTKRFLQRKTINSCFYDVTSMKNKIACTLGYGKKIQLANKNVSPPPGSYNPIYPDENKKKISQSFGHGRQSVKFGSIMQDYRNIRDNPSPVSYHLKVSSLQKNNGLMSKRLATQYQIISRNKSPGPGHYYSAEKTNLDKSGSYFLSKFKNCSIPRYQSIDKQPTKRQRVKTVGPSDYQDINKFGKSLISRYKNSVNSSFTKAERPGPENTSSKNVPGYKYKRFSEFGTKI